MGISDFARVRFLHGVELANIGDRMSAYIKTDDYASAASTTARVLDDFNRKTNEYGFEPAQIDRIRQDLSNIRKQAEAHDKAALLNSLRNLKGDVMPASYKSFATVQQQYEQGIIKWGNERVAEVISPAVEGPGEAVPAEYRYLIGWLREPLPELTLAEPVEVTERKIDAVLKQLKDGVETIQGSERFRLFLTTMSKFQNYSIGNQILIMIQKPGATHVAGFATWKELGRWVKKGEKGISILAPRFPPRPTCPICGAKIGKDVKFCSKCGASVEAAEIEVTPAYFIVVSVFDIGQTDGKPLPEFEVPVLSGVVNEELFTKTMALTKAQGLTVSFEPCPQQDPSIKGEYFGKSIWVKPDEPRAQQLKSLLHEVAHYYTEGVFHIARRDAETIAESAAFVVGAHYGFDTGVRSFPYVALWAQDKKILEQNLSAIRKVSTEIMESLHE